jgi:hypothetical protein
VHLDLKNGCDAVSFGEQRYGDHESKRHKKPFAEGDKTRASRRRLEASRLLTPDVIMLAVQ